MKCLFDFGFCCRTTRTRSPPPPPQVEADDTLSLAAETCGSIGSRRRRRLSGGGRSKSGTGAHWSPRLKAISEDVVAPVDEIRSDRFRKRSASKRESMDRSYSFSHVEEYYLRY